MLIDPKEKTKYKYKIRVNYQDHDGKKHAFNMKIGKKKDLHRVDGISEDLARAKNN